VSSASLIMRARIAVIDSRHRREETAMPVEIKRCFV